MARKVVDLNENMELWAIDDIAEIEFNQLNPNVMNPKEFDALKHSIVAFGLSEFPAVVRNEKTGKFLIIDGAHRVLAWKELKEKGETKDSLFVTLVKNINYYKALLGSFTFNRAKGRVKSERVVELLTDVKRYYDVAQIIRDTGLSKSDYEEYIKAAEEGRLANQLTKLESIEAIKDRIVRWERKELKIEPVKRIFFVSLAEEEYARVESALKHFANDHKTALLKMCEWVEKNYGSN